MSEPHANGPEKRIVPMVRNFYGQPEFRLTLSYGEWISRRVVTVTDNTVDITQLLRGIAKGETDATRMDCPSGEIFFTEGARQYRVGVFYTDESEDVIQMDICFTIDSRDDVNEVDGDDVEHITVRLVDEDLEANDN